MIKTTIINAAKALGIEKIGFSKEAVVALFPYFVKGEEGNLSLYARSLDYHTIAEDKLESLAKVVLDCGATDIKVHVDKGGMDDRKAAFDAGLGFFGQNGLVINPDYGSYFFIGQIVHNLEIEPGTPDERECLMCGRCERECPVGAISGGKVDSAKCLSNISQKKGELLPEEEAALKKHKLCWGCDTCQSVCPHNRGIDTTAIPEFKVDRISRLTSKDLEGLSNREFNERYGKYAFSWRGKNVLLRNLKIHEEK